MSQAKRGFFSWLCHCAPDDALDNIITKYEQNHLDHAKALDEMDKDRRLGLEPLGFADRVVKDQLWRAAAVDKAAIYDQFYTFMCWACPVGWNVVCFWNDWTHLEDAMNDGTAMKMTCGNCCKCCRTTPVPEPEAFSKFHGAYYQNEFTKRKVIKELIVIASCPGDAHTYFTLDMYLDAKMRHNSEHDSLWFDKFLEELRDPNNCITAKPPMRNVKMDGEEAAAWDRYVALAKKSGDPSAERAAMLARDAAVAPDASGKGIHSSLAAMAKHSQGYVVFSPIQFINDETRQDKEHRSLFHPVDVRANALARDHYCISYPAWGRYPPCLIKHASLKPGTSCSHCERYPKCPNHPNNCCPKHPDVPRDTDLGEPPAGCICAEVLKCGYCKRYPKSPIHPGCAECKEISEKKAMGVNGKPNLTYEHDFWQAYWMANVRMAIASAKNKYSVEQIKVLAVYGGGPGAAKEREKLHDMGLLGHTKKTQREATKGLFTCGMCCMTAGFYNCAKASCPGTHSAIYMAEAMVLRFLLCADSRDVEVEYLTVDYNDLVDYLSGDKNKELKTRQYLNKEEYAAFMKRLPADRPPSRLFKILEPFPLKDQLIVPCACLGGASGAVAPLPMAPKQVMMESRVQSAALAPAKTPAPPSPEPARRLEDSAESSSKSQQGSGWTREQDPTLKL